MPQTSKTTSENEVDPQIVTSKPPLFFHQRLKAFAFIFPSSIGFRTQRFGFRTFLKAGRHISLTEADTMRFVSLHTSIPVPKVQRAWCNDGITYIIMDFVQGEELEAVWRKMSEPVKRRVLDQLGDYVHQLRSIPPPADVDGRVVAVNNGALYDSVRVGLNPYGPFDSHDAFHQYLRAGHPLEDFEREDAFRELFQTHNRKYSTVFTHGDFAPRNILVKEDGTVTAIVDWECAGWLPEYWEYSKARYTPYFPSDWVASIGDIVGSYEEEFQAERCLWMACGCMLSSVSRL
ncbi:hypothetical protein Hypma_009008 [Hypsizygus marmoreus]|uniref:Aminoglycoside phosphotransferase domain-containing protein n=1 Tax=Hypsizygus marmoreus TaxID=39966 RepID=A0A369JQM1_HYPMA|nr:hypothetical protein Hypma_009008 [Hypsizygus marmoreus]